MSLSYYSAAEVITGWETCNRRPRPWVPTTRDEHDVKRSRPTGYERPANDKRNQLDVVLLMWLRVEKYRQSRHTDDLAGFAEWYALRRLPVVPIDPDENPPLKDGSAFVRVPIRIAVEAYNKERRESVSVCAATMAARRGALSASRPKGLGWHTSEREIEVWRSELVEANAARWHG